MKCEIYIGINKNIIETIKERLKSYAAFSMALDENTDISDTTQHVIFIRAVTAGFDVVEVFFDMASLSSTNTGQHICEHMIRVVEQFELNPAKLCGVATDGAPSMTGRTNGFNKNLCIPLEHKM